MSDEIASAVSTDIAASAPSTPAVLAAQSAVQPERTFTQEDLNRVVQDRVNQVKTTSEQKGYERARSEFESRVQAQPYAAQPDPDSIRKLIAEEAEKMRTEGAIHQALNTFRQRVSEGYSDPEYPDYKETVEVLNDETMTPVALLASQFENTKDLMYHLGKNAADTGNLLNLMSKSETVPYARMMLSQISNSIKTNKEAKKQPVARPPLSQVTPSTTGVDSGSADISIEDRRRKSSLRF